MPSFSDTRNILNRRPKIQFVEPDQIPGIQAAATSATEPLAARRETVSDVIAQYTRLEQLSDIAQKRIDARAKNMKACLDPTNDSSVIVSLHRLFGDVPECITYEQYKHCLEAVSKLGQKAAVRVTPGDLESAADPYRTSFGGYTKTNGGLRPELQFDSPVKPIDQASFQKDSVKKLFKMMLPMLSSMTDTKILDHLVKAPHSSK